MDPMPLFKPGDGCTRIGYSDQTACTITEVSKNGRTITFREDKATLLNGPKSGAPDALTFAPGGFCGHTEGVQRWETEPDPKGIVKRATWRAKLGCFKIVGWPSKSPGGRVIAGRHHHYDYNF